MSAVDHLDSKPNAGRGDHGGSPNHRTEIVGQVGEGVAVATLDGILTYVNSAWADMHGYSCEELLGRHLSISHSSRQMVEDVEPFNAMVRETGRFQGEVGHITRDGVEFPTLMTTTLTRDEHGEPLELVAVARDITRAKQSEAEERTRGRFLGCLSDVSQLLIGATDLESALPSALQLLGETAEVSRTYIFSNRTGPDGALRCDLVARWSDTSTPPPPAEDSGLHDLPYAANGLQRWIDVLGSGRILSGSVADFPASEQNRLEPYGIQSLLLIPLFISDRWYGYIGFDSCETTRDWSVQEIDLLKVAAAEISSAIENQMLLAQLESEAQNLEERVAERTAELSAVNHELEAFASSVSHDLRAPLRAIGGFSRALLEDYGNTLDDQGRDFLKRIVSAHLNMRQLIDNLLKLSRLAGREMVKQQVDLSKLARSVAASLEENEPERTVEVEISDGLTATGDPHLLRIALHNLLENAWKFTNNNPAARIEFNRAPGEGSWAFRVRDNGAGFDMRYAERLFRPFQRLHDPAEYEGTGIGLATVQRIIHRHGGTVWAESTPGEGATFIFTLGDRA